MSVIWSFSHSRAFDRCQRNWFYNNIFGNGVAKDKDRHEIYLLSKLQTISAWRGSIVYACPVRTMMAVLEKRLQEHQAAQRLAAGNDTPP